MENNLSPKLRFPEFQDNWKESKLSQIAKFSKGKGISKSDIDENGEIECVRYGELYTHYKETINEVKSRTNLSKEELIFSEENDVIIPASGETQLDIATASCVTRSGIALGGDLNIIKSKANGVFLSYYLNSKKKIDIAKLAQGISVVHLYSSQLALLKINLPNSEEQQKIATFLTSVDERLTLLAQQKEKLELYKKGVMQQIFSQKLRFKDENGKDYPDWEEKKLGDICEKKSSNISANTLEKNQGKFKIYGATGFLKNIDFYQEENEYISIVKDGAGVGRILLCDAKSSVLGTLDKIFPKLKIDIYFLFTTLENIDFTKYSTGSTIPHIYFKDYSKEKIKIPCLEEQQKIASFLSAIDVQIEGVSKKIEQTKLFKKGLLQQMFV